MNAKKEAKKFLSSLDIHWRHGAYRMHIGASGMPLNEKEEEENRMGGISYGRSASEAIISIGLSSVGFSDEDRARAQSLADQMGVFPEYNGYAIGWDGRMVKG